MDDPAAKLANLSARDREEMEAMSVADLLDAIEGSGYHSEAGPLVNRIEWIALKARIEKQSRHAL
jgi:hypothetical protein